MNLGGSSQEWLDPSDTLACYDDQATPRQVKLESQLPAAASGSVSGRAQVQPAWTVRAQLHAQALPVRKHTRHRIKFKL